jgi:hypothetical protein
MYSYSIFGGVLRSEIEIPELQGAPLSAAATWNFHVEGGLAPPVAAGQVVARDEIGGGATAALVRTAAGMRLVYSDTGTFEIARGGRDITWYRAPDAPRELARLDLIGRVLATSLHMMGAVCLHASAVDVNGRAVAFLGPKGFGKTTTAVALTREGARLVTDDTLVVFPGRESTCVPGVQSARLRLDAARVFAEAGPEPTTVAGDGRVMYDPPPDLLMTGRVPLAALYVLSPVQPDSTTLVERRPLASLPAAIAIISHGKLGPLQGVEEAAENLERITRLAESVPVYSLPIARDLARMGEVARVVFGWHAERAVAASDVA